ncbi:MAG: hypothetical protein ACMXYA_03570, partial [Candidatus Woesearchaeota archaeon]
MKSGLAALLAATPQVSDSAVIINVFNYDLASIQTGVTLPTGDTGSSIESFFTVANNSTSPLDPSLSEYSFNIKSDFAPTLSGQSDPAWNYSTNLVDPTNNIWNMTVTDGSVIRNSSADFAVSTFYNTVDVPTLEGKIQPLSGAINFQGLAGG